MKYRYFDEEYDEFLQHYQIKGAKHGVRRFQNEDGSWTPAGRERYGKGGKPRGSYSDGENSNKSFLSKWKEKRDLDRAKTELVKEFKSSIDPSRPYKTSEEFNRKAEKLLKKSFEAHKEELDAKDRAWSDSMKQSSKKEEEFRKLAEKYGKEYYDMEIKQNPSAYESERSKQKLHEYAVLEYGRDKAMETNPELHKNAHSSDRLWNDYENLCNNIAKEALGDSGDPYLFKNAYTSYKLSEALGRVVGDIHLKSKQKPEHQSEKIR